MDRPNPGAPKLPSVGVSPLLPLVQVRDSSEERRRGWHPLHLRLSTWTPEHHFFRDIFLDLFLASLQGHIPGIQTAAGPSVSTCSGLIAEFVGLGVAEPWKPVPCPLNLLQQSDKPGPRPQTCHETRQSWFKRQSLQLSCELSPSFF